MIQGKPLLSDMIRNVRTEVLHARLARCGEDWRNLDYIPSYSKFYFILEGECWLKIGDQEYHPQPGDFFLMPAGVRQGYAAISNQPLIKYFCHFNARVGDISLFDLINLPPFVTIGNPEPISQLFEQMLQNRRDNRLAAGLAARSALDGLLAAYLDEVPEDAVRLVDSEATAILKTVLVYIDEHLAEPLPVSRLAELVHYHPVYFSRFFKKHVLLSPKSYISQKRLDKAKNLLSHTGLSIAEIAVRTGYPDLFYFSSTFKDHFGLAPTEYRGNS